MKDHRKPNRPIRTTIIKWSGLAVVLIMFTITTPGVLPSDQPSPSAASFVAYGLGGIGWVTCTCLLIICQNRWEPDRSDHHRLAVLALQASATATVGALAQAFWGAQVVGLPVVISLVAVATLRDAAEAVLLAIAVRDTYYRRLEKKARSESARHSQPLSLGCEAAQ